MKIMWRAQFPGGRISLNDNPIKKPPAEIIQQGKEAVRIYFKSIEEKEKVVKLNEIRILLVGDGMAGKTSLLKQIQDLKFNEHESQTHGINVVTLLANDIHGLEDLSKIN